MVITYPVGFLVDDAGALLNAPVVTIVSVKDKAGNAIASPGATVNNSGSALPISVDYDAEVKGEAWITLAVSQAGKVITGVNASIALFAARDSGRVLTDLDAAVTSRASATVAPSWWTAPDNADIVTALADLVTLLSRTDPTTALTAVKVVTDKIATMISGSPSVFTAPALVNTPVGGSGHVYFVADPNSTKAKLTFRVGDAGITIQEVLRYPDGTPIDLTGKTVTLSLIPVQGSAALWSHAATIDWATGGVAHYILTADDLAIKGSYYRLWTVTDGGATTLSYPEDTNLSVLIQ